MKHKKLAHWDYTKRTSQEQSRTGMVDRETKVRKLADDLNALDELQAKRPAKPPGRR